MISFRDFAMRRGERLLLSNVDLTLHAGWRVGVIGRNGTGKSSLFAAIQGEVEADRGDIDVPNRVRIASVAQETPALDDPALDFVLSGDANVYKVIAAEREAVEREDWEAVAEAHHQLEELGGYDATARAGKLLHGLGFSADTHERAVKEFSGGWRVRLNLARALMTPSDLLLLDEPTNHLDLDAVLWLEQWLLKYPGTLLLISHDREFLDEVTTHTLHLHDGKAKLYTGDYTAFERQRAEHLRLQQITHEKQQAERAHLQSFIDRFSASAAKAKQAQSRVKRLAKMVGTEAVRQERALRIEFPAPTKLPHALLRLIHADCGYGDHVVLDDVSFILEAGDRIALLGPNGAGKSTLVKSLVGELELLTGERGGHPDLRIGYFAQHTVESLHEGVSPIDHLAEIAPGVSTQQLRDFLGKWNFPGDRAFESVDGFSGGERARLALAMIAWRKPNVLLLDEPTNHLDLDVREALAEALSDFDGAIVLVSHDRHLIGLVCETFWRVADGVAQPFDGDLDAYAVWLRTRDNSNDGKGAAAAKAAAQATAAGKAAPAGKGARKANPHKLAEAEKRMAELESKLHTLDMDLADPTKYAGGGDNAAELAKQREQVAAELAKAEAEWMALYDAA
ncbi:MULTISPECIES: ABC-F family ATP-binding cassette domain-containing protein [Lysobacter]|uniref:ATP-binding cassette domain-containing protein n=1 Tax=Lysobacter gummosus TaxID=262324 RepID=A0ABY3X7C6_9GAMM|nr:MULTISPECIES: ABC-F family ATP-binding cassette domain-containing protein [Lysobacter]ALN92943.1 ABC transporter family protein [Lysobacter gummosus]UJB20262.1 ATP-binding cassette domain-containing protein [Lysobacter capsici]UJQ30624.1 ATP-binding cassette domain-containing protein [Lysobacter gummosus]UNP28486.1 ATP-binding cassette domain-containing protein [Lysobacter gummosus]